MPRAASGRDHQPVRTGFSLFCVACYLGRGRDFSSQFFWNPPVRPQSQRSAPVIGYDVASPAVPAGTIVPDQTQAKCLRDRSRRHNIRVIEIMNLKDAVTKDDLKEFDQIGFFLRFHSLVQHWVQLETHRSLPALITAVLRLRG